MTQEEKAKRYDKVVGKLKQFMTQGVDPLITRADVQDFFPELFESEDEKMELLEHLKSCLSTSSTTIWKKKYQWWIAWLEKQGENISLPKFKFDDVLALQCAMEAAKKVQKDKDLYEQLESLHNRLHDAYWLKKQGKQNPNPCDGCVNRKGCIYCENGELREVEQTPDDKVEPKFHEGDWVVSNRYTSKPFCITKICDTHYLVDNDSFILFEQESDWRLWTIQDAKDGDVLVDSLGNVCIYQEPSTKLMYHSYCYGNHKCFIDMGGSHGIVGSYPATKEQRDLLFQKMKEAGYEWDAEKKELKKIEQKPAEWSEEDEELFEEIKRCVGIQYPLGNPCIFKFLKFLKDRYTWKPSEEQLGVIAQAMAVLKVFGYGELGDRLGDISEQLNKLKS
jgi:hypothetical protein